MTRPFRQERYASSPALEKGLNAVLVASRCTTLSDPREIELVWFIQWKSMKQGGLDKFAGELIAAFPERMGTPAMLKIGTRRDGLYDADQVRTVRDESCSPFMTDDFPLRGEVFNLFRSMYVPANEEERERHSENLRRDQIEADRQPSCYPVSIFLDECGALFLKNVPDLLTRFCLDPKCDASQLRAATDRHTPLPYFHDLHGALLEYMERWEGLQLAKIAETAVGKTMLDAMAYAEAERTLVLVEGVYGTGKTFPSQAWCEARPGKRRYVQCPSSNDALDFFRTIAEPIGVSAALSRGTGQLRARVNDVLQAGYLSIVLDESHWLWSCGTSRVAMPGRVTWLMTALVNYSVPVVLVATPQFTASQVRVEQNSGWQSGQFVGRVSRYVSLPVELERADLRAIAEVHLPGGDEKSIKALVLYAEASKKRLRGIEHGVRAARHVARCAGRDQVTFADIKQAMEENVMPSDSALNAALSKATAPAKTGRRASKIYAEPVQLPSGLVNAGLIVKPGREVRPAASLSSA